MRRIHQRFEKEEKRQRNQKSEKEEHTEKRQRRKKIKGDYDYHEHAPTPPPPTPSPSTPSPPTPSPPTPPPPTPSPSTPSPPRDTDQDGVPDSRDAFPADVSKWRDTDQEKLDSDADGVADDMDAFPQDPNCQQVGQQGCGGHRDINGVPAALDKYPHEATYSVDTDSDGVPDVDDLYKGDPSESRDTDGDGVGNRADDFPDDIDCQTFGVNGCGGDRDGDGVPDQEDKFPDNPKEWKDSDRDGVGDNEDKFPNDPHCQREGQKGCTGVIIKPSKSKEGGIDKKLQGKTRNSGLPEQGYNEYVKGPVKHADMRTHTEDWLNERPKLGQHDTESSETARICRQNPSTLWCRLYLSKKGHR